MLLVAVGSKPTMDYGRNMVDMKKLTSNIWYCLWLCNIYTLENAGVDCLESCTLRKRDKNFGLLGMDVALENNESSIGM